MSELYVANVTKQEYTFTYRIPESKKLHMVAIQPGTQTIIRHDSIAIACIIDQYQKYGMISVAEMEKGKTFHGLVYRIDKPVNVDSIMGAIKRNDKALLADGEKKRHDITVAVNHMLAKQAQEMDNRLSGLEMEFIEQPRDPNVKGGERNHTKIRVDNGNGTTAAKRARRSRPTIQ